MAVWIKKKCLIWSERNWLHPTVSFISGTFPRPPPPPPAAPCWNQEAYFVAAAGFRFSWTFFGLPSLPLSLFPTSLIQAVPTWKSPLVTVLSTLCGPAHPDCCLHPPSHSYTLTVTHWRVWSWPPEVDAGQWERWGHHADYCGYCWATKLFRSIFKLKLNVFIC